MLLDSVRGSKVRKVQPQGNAPKTYNKLGALAMHLCHGNAMTDGLATCHGCALQLAMVACMARVPLMRSLAGLSRWHGMRLMTIGSNLQS